MTTCDSLRLSEELAALRDEQIAIGFGIWILESSVNSDQVRLEIWVLEEELDEVRREVEYIRSQLKEINDG